MEPSPLSFDRLARSHGIADATAREFAVKLDTVDPLAHLRKEFHIPRVHSIAGKTHDPSAEYHTDSAAVASQPKQVVTPVTSGQGYALSPDDECVYLCGNSLGLQPKRTRALLQEELDVWAESGVHGHFDHRFGRPWVSVDDLVLESSARIVGAKKEEVAVLNSLTVNVHLLMVPFYRPTATRFKILMEEKAFPSDQYAVESQLRFHGYTRESALITVKPRPGEHIIRNEDILQVIREEGSSIALILFTGVHYYTGQFFDIASIAEAGQRQGCVVGLDLAHAVGNVELKLHDWNVDFAAWCSYKYLNSGPGGISGIYVHERHQFDTKERPRFAGWWSSPLETRFQMRSELEMIPGVQGFRMSNPCVLAVIALLGSLQVFDKTSMKELREKSRLLTGYLEFLLQQLRKELLAAADFEIATPAEAQFRGCQLSLVFSSRNVKPLFTQLMHAGVVCDKREPDCIRVAPVPMYNSFVDVWRFVQLLRAALQQQSPAVA